MINKKERLDNLKNSIIQKNLTPDLSKQAINLVFGSGLIDSEIMIIGEAPGAKEDKMGEPFVGASGKVLDQLLEGINLNREDVYITNIVKYRPPKNRDPSKEEKAIFWPILLEQIKIIKPRIIVPLGRHSAGQFLPEIVISQHHGQIFKYKIDNEEFQVLPLYHPAATIYNRKLRPELEADFQKIAQILAQKS